MLGGNYTIYPLVIINGTIEHEYFIVIYYYTVLTYARGVAHLVFGNYPTGIKGGVYQDKNEMCTKFLPFYSIFLMLKSNKHHP